MLVQKLIWNGGYSEENLWPCVRREFLDTPETQSIKEKKTDTLNFIRISPHQNG